MKYLDLVFWKLQEKKLIVKLEKSEFIVSHGSLKMDKDNIEAIFSWPAPRYATEVRIFHGLT